MKQYTYALVQLQGMSMACSYLSDDPEIRVGSLVLVPFGRENVEKTGTVIDLRVCTEADAPFPPEKTKHILRRLGRAECEVAPEQPETREPRTPGEGKAAELPPEELEEYLDSTEEDDYDYDFLFDWAWAHGEELDSPETMELVIRCYQLCAAQNMPLACLNLGTFYYNGTYLERDYRKAAALYKIAADSGVPVGIRNLGYCYYYGRHQAVDYAKAYEYFCKGALLFSDANCLYKLGDMYRRGLAVEKNEKYAYILYERALDAEHADEEEYGFCLADILLRLGECRLKGIGTTADAEGAHTLLLYALDGFYERRKTDPFVSGLIKNAKARLREAEALLDEEII